MATRSIAFITILSLFIGLPQLSGQLQGYLDLDYGISGVATLPFEGYAYVQQNLVFDENDRAYLGSLTLHQDTADVVTTAGYFFTRLSASGFREDWGIDVPTSANWLNTGLLDTLISYKYLDGKIISDKIINGEEDTIREVKRYDLDFNLEVEYEAPEPVNYFTLLWYYVRNDLIEFDKENRLIIGEGGMIYRYKENGEKDETFGDQGSATVFRLDSSYIELFLNLYSDVLVLDDNSILYTALEYYDETVDTVSYRGLLSKVTDQGRVDASFGNDGYVTGMSRSYFWDLQQNSNEDFFALGYELNTACPSNYSINKYDVDGRLNNAYGNNGHLDIGCNESYSSHIQVGPEGEILILEYEMIYEPDSITFSHYDYRLARVDAQGTIDTTFGEGGRLDLEVTELVLDLAVDKAANLYIMSMENFSTLYDSNNLFVKKLKADKIWSHPPTNTSEPINLAILPNPSIGSPQVRNTGNRLRNVEISLFDMQGRLISIKQVELLEPNEETLVSNQDLSAGTYLVKVVDGAGRSSFWEKVVVVE